MVVAGADFVTWADLGIKVLALAALATGVLQLVEARRKRKVDLYWELVERYLSPDGRRARQALQEVEEALGLSEEELASVAVDSPEAAEVCRAAASRYNTLFHGSTLEHRRDVHPAVLYRLRYLDQAGVLLRKGLVDRELMLGLIAAGVRVDLALIRITLTAVRQHEGFRVYPNVGGLIAEVKRYMIESDARGASSCCASGRSERVG